MENDQYWKEFNDHKLGVQERLLALEALGDYPKPEILDELVHIIQNKNEIHDIRWNTLQFISNYYRKSDKIISLLTSIDS